MSSADVGPVVTAQKLIGEIRSRLTTDVARNRHGAILPYIVVSSQSLQPSLPLSLKSMKEIVPPRLFPFRVCKSYFVYRLTTGDAELPVTPLPSPNPPTLDPLPGFSPRHVVRIAERPGDVRRNPYKYYSRLTAVPHNTDSQSHVTSR